MFPKSLLARKYIDLEEAKCASPHSRIPDLDFGKFGNREKHEKREKREKRELFRPPYRRFFMFFESLLACKRIDLEEAKCALSHSDIPDLDFGKFENRKKHEKHEKREKHELFRPPYHWFFMFFKSLLAGKRIDLEEAKCALAHSDIPDLDFGKFENRKKREKREKRKKTRKT